KYIHVMKLPVKIICHEKFRSLLSLAHDRANMISRHADRFARELRHEPGYERIIYMPGIKLAPIVSAQCRDCFSFISVSESQSYTSG
ncbi:TPA: hypothetical protein ACIO89_005435, partial [Salmonella enterica subsp. enterica serovar Java]